MTAANPPRTSVRSSRHMVATADQIATSAGNEMFAAGGNAVDAAIAANAAIAVTGPHLCGMGGDLFALVHVDGEVVALNAAGRAGAGADSAELRAAGLPAMPFRHDIRSVTVPGCVDGWVALHERFGTLPLSTLLAPAQRLASTGFPASPLLVGALARLDGAGRAALDELATQATSTGAVVRRTGVAAALAGIAADGRDAFYEGDFGAGLIDLGNGLFSAQDLATSQANWEAPLSASAFGVDLHTIGPPTQGYLALASSRLASRLDLPDDPDDERWAHLLIEATTAAGHDRPDVLHDGADGSMLIDAIDERFGDIDMDAASRRWAPDRDGDTTYLCTAGVGRDGRMMGVSLIQSNAAGFGSHIVEPSTGINLHNRGMGFSVEAGHPAEFRAGRRPPHTLSPAMATRNDRLVSVFGTMGGDAQPHILLQLAARLFHHHQSPATAVNSGRWALRGPDTGFDTWTAPEGPHVAVEGHAPTTWTEDLAVRGHRSVAAPAWDSGFGHAHAICVGDNDVLIGAADPRTVVGSCAGI